ncbi:hypothetical protein BCR44DRAFT_1036556 [Catenaria anguillulae PL171]|uniref:FAD/NAD(P)-binding domain-containing protein n=1 Tax=Catenaria anguillulae PL171 TaxID=765915 RepID=A0A1Y2HSP4_9FUNG|nr:hypothetical protein BCR44DRAFT_1036556 [Catenaria anguillulae PL171]
MHASGAVSPRPVGRSRPFIKDPLPATAAAARPCLLKSPMHAMLSRVTLPARRLHSNTPAAHRTMTMTTTPTYSAAVIGAGPAGLAVVARLLDTNPAHTIAWIDPSFSGGRLVRYPEVPSNTKVKLFLKYAQVSPALCKAAQVPVEGGAGALAKLEMLDQDAGCELVHAQRMTMHLARNLAVAYPEAIVPVKGWVAKIEHGAADNLYSLKVHEGVADPFSHTPAVDGSLPTRTVTAHHLYVCTGSEPVPIPTPAPAPHDLAPHPISVLDLDTCLTPSKLPSVLASATGSPRTWP